MLGDLPESMGTMALQSTEALLLAPDVHPVSASLQVDELLLFHTDPLDDDVVEYRPPLP